MNLLYPKIIKELLLKYETRPSKGLGQNFLIDKNVLKKIIDSADIKTNDIILEVGPGVGTLTQELAKKAKKVIAIEKDKTMVNILTDVLNDLNIRNVQVVNDDILKTRLQLPKKYKIVANIPYYLTSPLIRKFLEGPEGYPNPPEEMILMLQKEVAQRICAKPPDMSLLTVSVQFYAEPKIISYVSKNCFWPAPKVDSAIIRIIPQIDAAEKQINSDSFFKIVKAGFSHPRKQLVNNLTTLKSLNGVKLTKEQISNWLSKNNIKPNQRSETLSVSDWENLTKSFNT
jgi:16S rRNA (adenine1518-N6/adenine1519-N6)-dimethyltransferase